MTRMSELAMDVETAGKMATPQLDVGFDVWRLRSVTVDLLDHAKHNPSLLARDRAAIAGCLHDLNRMLSNLVKDAA